MSPCGMMARGRPRALAAGALLGSLLLAGCGSEPTGDDAYSQKFEKPEGVVAEAKEEVNPHSERAADIKKAQQEPLQPKSRKKR